MSMIVQVLGMGLFHEHNSASIWSRLFHDHDTASIWLETLS